MRLAPLYDVASILAYEHIDLRAAKLAMRVGRHYKLQTIQPRHWDDAAKSLKVPDGVLLQRIRDMTTEFPDAVADTARAVERQHLRHPNLTRLRDQLQLRIAAIKESIAATQL